MPVSSSLSLSLSFSPFCLFVCRSLFFFRFSNFNFKTPLFCFAKFLGFHSPSPPSHCHTGTEDECPQGLKGLGRGQRFRLGTSWGPRLRWQTSPTRYLFGKEGEKPKTKNQSCPFSLCVKFDFFVVWLGVGFAWEIVSERCGWGRSCWSGRYDQVGVFEWAWCALQSSEEICSQWYICESKSYLFFF